MICDESAGMREILKFKIKKFLMKNDKCQHQNQFISEGFKISLYCVSHPLSSTVSRTHSLRTLATISFKDLSFLVKYYLKKIAYFANI